MCIRKDEALSIYKILHCLEEPYKEVFILRVLGDLSFREIGEIFGKQETWARVTYHRARLKIKEVMI
ncbi:MAG: RNA polymerase sigma factor [[Clostridium] scindens]